MVLIKESTCQCQRCGINSGVRKISWRRKWQPTPVFLPRKSHGQLGGLQSMGSQKSHTTEATEHAGRWGPSLVVGPDQAHQSLLGVHQPQDSARRLGAGKTPCRPERLPLPLLAASSSSSARPRLHFPCMWTSEGAGEDSVSGIHRMETVRRLGSPKRPSRAPGLPRLTPPQPATHRSLARKGLPRQILIDFSLPLCL